VDHRALLGVWKDCNADGYVGLAESAVETYRSELLAQWPFVGDSICPVGSPFNDGAWVDEYLAIGMVDPCEYEGDAYRAAHCPSDLYGFQFNFDAQSGSDAGTVPAYNPSPRDLYLNGTYVWGDNGLPGAAPSPACPLRPLARGTTASTGGLLGFADCRDGHALVATFDAVAEANALTQPYSFGDAPTDPQRSASPLDVHFPASLFGDPVTGKAGLAQRDSGDAAFTTWDCARPVGTLGVPAGGGPRSVTLADPSGGSLSGQQEVPVVGSATVFERDPSDPTAPGTLTEPLTDARGDYLALPAFAPSVHDPTGSYWDAADATADGATAFGRGGDCDPATTSLAHDNYPGTLVESDQPDLAAKNAPDHTLVFYDGYRGTGDPDGDRLFGSSFPSDLGVSYTRNVYGGPMWSEMQPTLTEPQLLDRSTLGPQGPQYESFYARIDPALAAAAGLTLPNALPAAYGAPACGSFTTGVHGGWQCDASLWWRDAGGNDVRPRWAEGAPLGQDVSAEYELLDVDCYDDSAAAGTPGYAELAAGASCS
jgi:hypothetical protein